jgi:hypothetical protein
MTGIWTIGPATAVASAACASNIKSAGVREMALFFVAELMVSAEMSECSNPDILPRSRETARRVVRKRNDARERFDLTRREQVERLS